MPDWIQRMQNRYATVCDDCLPNVEAEIRRRDEMARTRALGAFLKDSRGKDKKRLVETQARRDKFEKSLLVWKMRGCLWVLTLLASLGFHFQGRSCDFYKYVVEVQRLIVRISRGWICPTDTSVYVSVYSGSSPALNSLDSLGSNICHY